MKKLCLLVVFCCLFAAAGAQTEPQNSYSQTVQNALKAGDSAQCIALLQTALQQKSGASAAERLEIASVLAVVQEQLGLFAEAQSNYSVAANLSAAVNRSRTGNAVADTEYLLGAVRCALCCGNTIAADYILSTAFNGVSDTAALAYTKLYAVWSWLCKIQSETELKEPLAVLKSMTDLQSLNTVKPSVLLTLWYFTGDASFAASLEKDFPLSPEAAVVKGESAVLPTVFWYMGPAGYSSTGVAQADKLVTKIPVDEESVSALSKGSEPVTEPASDKTVSAVTSETAAKKADADVQSEAVTETASNVPAAAKEYSVYQQTGFYRNRDYAEEMVDKLAAAGFSSTIRSEVRSSGTTYYAVLVGDDAAGTMGAKLKKAGFDCYPVSAD
ncbi:MAG: SPOR domain-containing protein [Treponemataceae bacterium]|nr:SPOR domain-containing protein [Treponemataceae bacterium]